MIGPSIELLHNGRWTLFVQRLRDGRFNLILVGEAVPEIAERKDAAGRLITAAAPEIPEVIEQREAEDAATFPQFKTEGQPFSAALIRRELAALPPPRRTVHELTVTRGRPIK